MRPELPAVASDSPGLSAGSPAILRRVLAKPGMLAPFLALDRRVWLLALARCVNTMGFSLVMPFMAMHLVEERGTSGAVYGAIYLVAGVVAAIGQGIAGEASDRIGRRKVMISGLAVRSVNMAALGVAVLQSAPVWVIGLLVITNGMLRAQFEPAASAAVTELTRPESRVHAYGLQRIGVNVGWAIGPAMGGFLASHSYGTLFFVAAPATLLAIFAVLPVPNHAPSTSQTSSQTSTPATAEPAQKTDPHAKGTGAGKVGLLDHLAQLRAALRENRVFALYLVLVLVGSVMTVQIFSTLSVFSSAELGLSKADVGLLYTVNGLFVVLFQVPAVALAKPWGMRRALVLGAVLYAVGYVIFGASSGFGGLAIGMSVLTLGEVVFAPALSDTAATLGDPERLGRAFGLFGLMQSLGVSLGPLVGGVAFDHLRSDHLVLWSLMAAGMVVVALAYSAFGRRYRVFDKMAVG
ncbi:MFS transporter [Vulgatibacter incomptus]|uniref:MFS transporter n=1 Tax=Vulgatibacter incomptus TaxID=1391653 RepID=UPI00147069F5|nr:MFS transporter [Vulgatibacter incomptus]